MNGSNLLDRIVTIVVAASDGTVAGPDLLAGDVSLADAGLTSLAYLRLIDSIETEFGVYLDLEEAGDQLGTVRGIAAYVAAESMADA